jgi:hypothetical protein
MKTVPVSEGHTLRVKWVIPGMEEHWREMPDSFLSHLLGHEGKGSLFAQLKDQGLVKALSAGGGQLYKGAGSFVLAMTLTDEGACAALRLRPPRTAGPCGLLSLQKQPLHFRAAPAGGCRQRKSGRGAHEGVPVPCAASRAGRSAAGAV